MIELLLILAVFFWVQCGVAMHSTLKQTAIESKVKDFPDKNGLVAAIVFIYVVIFWPHMYIRIKV